MARCLRCKAGPEWIEGGRHATKTQYVYAVLYVYDYEGGTLEAVYRTLTEAKKHPSGGNTTSIVRMPVRERVKP